MRKKVKLRLLKKKAKAKKFFKMELKFTTGKQLTQILPRIWPTWRSERRS